MKLFTFLALGLIFIDSTFGYLESLAASVTGTLQNQDDPIISQPAEPFKAMVAFQCGYRNRYYSKEGGGTWITDLDPNAACLTGKLDILKYCKKVYPNLRITNIVESTREYELPSWCKIEGHPCKSIFKVKPYRCIVGNFESEALLVPENCHFGHVDDQKLCNDFDYWNQTAQRECSKRGQPESHTVKSFAMLEPCGLDMFAGVEYVCCPKLTIDSGLPKTSASSEQPSIDLKVKVKVGKELKQSQKQEKIEDDSSSDEDDDDDDQNDDNDVLTAKKSTISQTVKKRILTSTMASTIVAKQSTENPMEKTKVKEIQSEGGDDDDDDDDDSSENDPSPTADPYFRSADPDHEYAQYRSAIDRLEKQHRLKVTEALKKLTEAERKYEQKHEHDESQVEAMKTEFKHTMEKLEKEHHEERHRIEQIHEQRVAMALNERKRQAMKVYRQALYSASLRLENNQKQKQPPTQKVLKSLQAYIRAEEKDRMHGLNRYKYLLRADLDEAINMREGLIKKLHDIDLRINGTIEMARDVAGLIDKIKPAVVEFWQNFRDENTPGNVDDSLTWIGDYHNGEKLLEFYKKQNEYNFKKEHEAAKNQQYSHNHKSENRNKVKIESDIRQPIIPSPIVITQKLDNEENSQAKYDEIKHAHAFSLKETFQHAAAVKEEMDSHNEQEHHYGYVLLAVGGVTLLMATVLGMVVFRRRCSLHSQGFVAVDAMTPEERHVAGMQVNGYENPTYKHFDASKTMA